MTIPIIPGPWDWLRQLGEAGANVINKKSEGELKSYELSQQAQQQAQQRSAFMMQMLQSGLGDPNEILPALQSQLGAAGMGGVTPESIGSYGETIGLEQKARKSKAKTQAAESEADLANVDATRQAARFKALFPNIQADANNAVSEAILKLNRPPTPGDLESIAKNAQSILEQRVLKARGSVLTDQDREYALPFVSSAVHDAYLKWFHLQNEQTSAENRFGASSRSDVTRRLVAQFNQAQKIIQDYNKSQTSLVWKGYVDQNQPIPPELQKYYGTDIQQYRKAMMISEIYRMALNNVISPEDAQAKIDQLNVDMGPTMTGDQSKGFGGQPGVVRDQVVSAIVAKLKAGTMTEDNVRAGVGTKITQAEADQAIQQYRASPQAKKASKDTGSTRTF